MTNEVSKAITTRSRITINGHPKIVKTTCGQPSQALGNP